jgi:hypothetical protein
MATLLAQWTGRHDAGEDPYSLTMWSFRIGAAALLPLAWAEGILPHTDHLGRVLLLMAFRTEPVTDAGDDTHRRQEMTAEMKEIVIPAHLGHTQDIAPDGRKRDLCTCRGPLPCLGTVVARVGQSAAIDLAGAPARLWRRTLQVRPGSPLPRVAPLLTPPVWAQPIQGGLDHGVGELGRERSLAV